MGGLAFTIASNRGAAALAAAIVIASLFRFLRWVVEFAARRLDARADRLENLELELQRRMNKRLRHVEIELGRYRRVTMMLFNVVAEKDPTSRELREVARILNEAMPFEDPSQDFDDLLNKIGGNNATSS